MKDNFCDIDWGYADIVTRLADIHRQVTALSKIAERDTRMTMLCSSEISEILPDTVERFIEDEVVESIVKVITWHVCGELEYIVDQIKSARGDGK